MNRLKLLSALGASLAMLASEACNRSAPPSRQSASSAGQALTATTTTLATRIDNDPAALPGDTFSADVSFRDSSGNLMDVSYSATLSLSTNPTGAKLGGTLTAAAVHGVASFTNLSIATVGKGYQLTATSSSATSSVSSAFDVAYSQDDQQTVGQAPNNSIASAQRISPKVPVFGTLGAGEAHYYKLRAKAGQVLTVASFANRLDQANWDTSLRLRLIAPDGVTEMQRSGAVDGYARQADNDILMLVIPNAGDYYLVCDSDQQGFLSGKYGFWAGFFYSPPTQTEAEPSGTTGQNDTIATAEALSAGTVYGHYDYTAANTSASDFYKVTVAGPSRLHFELTAARNGGAYGSPTWDPRLELQDATGAVLAANDNSLYLDPTIDYIVTAAGSYYIRVTRTMSASNTGSSPYFLQYQPTAYSPTAAVTTNTSASAAMAIKYGTDVKGSFSAAGNQYFSFAGTAGDLVRLVVEDRSVLQGASLTLSPATGASGTTTTSDAVLLASDGATALQSGAQFSSSTDGQYNLRQTILQSTGTYYVRVSSAGAGSYGIRVELVNGSAREVEPNDTTTQANVIGVSGWISGAISSATDKDHFKVHAEALQDVTVSIYAASGGGRSIASYDWGSSLIPYLEIRDPSGNLVTAVSADRKGDLNFAEGSERTGAMMDAAFRAPVAGDYDILVADADGQGGANYFYALQISKNR